MACSLWGGERSCYSASVPHRAGTQAFFLLRQRNSRLPGVPDPPPPSRCPFLADSIIKSCSYKSFCDQARRGGSGGATVRCCFSDDCNGPTRGSRNGAGITPPPPPSLLATALAGALLLGRF